MSKEQIKKTLLGAIEKSAFKNSIQKASLFGSYAHETETEKSDIDVLVEFTPTAVIGLFDFARLQRLLGESTGKNVDLLTSESISSLFRDQVVNDAELIYER